MSESSRLQVKTFAAVKEAAGAESVEIDLPSSGTVGDVRQALTAALPEVAAVIQRSMFAVDQQFASDDAVVSPTAEVACIPPVSGG